MFRMPIFTAREGRGGKGEEPAYSWVHLVSFQTDDGSPRVVATCVLRDGVVTVEGEKGFVDQLSQGISFGPERRILLTDGVTFLESVLVQYRYPYLFATPIRSGDEVRPYQP